MRRDPYPTPRRGPRRRRAERDVRLRKGERDFHPRIAVPRAPSPFRGRRRSQGGLKDAPQAARVAVLINKVESPSQLEAARRVAGCILREPRVERVAIGALRGRPSSDWEVWPAWAT